MNKKLLIVNIVLIITIAALVAMASNIWLNPPYPSRVEIASVEGAAKKFETPPPLRQNYPPTTQESVIKQNLFRKERVEYVPPPPPPPPPQVPPKPTIPPPNLKVSGLMLFSPKKKIAVLEGTYSVLNGPTTIENKTLKKKGYNLGERIGTYHISDINKTTVILDNKEGSLVNVSLATRSAEDMIQRNGNHFFHKSKNPRPVAPPVSVGTPPPNAPPSPGQASPSSQASPPQPMPHISGAPMSPPGQPGRVISELERISGSKTHIPQGAISGAPTPPGTGAQGMISGAPTGSRISGG